jgi:subtilisin family serine protease
MTPFRFFGRDDVGIDAGDPCATLGPAAGVAPAPRPPEAAPPEASARDLGYLGRSWADAARRVEAPASAVVSDDVAPAAWSPQVEAVLEAVARAWPACWRPAPAPVKPRPSDLTAPDADDFRGAGKAVVVIDTGWSPLFDQRNTVYSFDFSGFDDADASVRTRYSHGSWVAQVCVRTAPDVDIIHLKVFSDNGANGAMVDIQEALDWVIDATATYDIAAVNLSLGFGNTTRKRTTILSDEFAALDELGVLNVVATGNLGSPSKRGVNVIAADRNAIGVSASDADGRLALFTQRSATLTDIAAPGVDIPVEATLGWSDIVSGTSYAAPYVAATAARLMEAVEAVYGEEARLDADTFLDILRDSGQPLLGAQRWKGGRIADSDAAVDWFLDNAAAYTDELFA